MTIEEIKAAFIQTDAIKGLEPDSMTIEPWTKEGTWSILFVCRGWWGLPKVINKQYAVECQFVNARVESRVAICLTLEPKQA